jgi:hypothetical protein
VSLGTSSGEGLARRGVELEDRQRLADLASGRDSVALDDHLADGVLLAAMILVT